TADSNTYAARPSASATSATTSLGRCSKPADSDPRYTLVREEPPNVTTRPASTTTLTATSPSDLRNKLTASGLACTGWHETLESGLAGTCSGNIRLVVNGDPGEASWDRLYEGNRDLFKRLVGSDQYSSLKMIIGANWYALVPAAQASDLAAATGAQTYK
ncbi:hypothetical protein, partial [Propionibacterium freudenreichii]|uniref:hypothetical protein n=2 Tax=Propionibacterium freudenreichii TaxID=1744 RepID=UPI00254DE060